MFDGGFARICEIGRFRLVIPRGRRYASRNPDSWVVRCLESLSLESSLSSARIEWSVDAQLLLRNTLFSEVLVPCAMPLTA